MPDTDHRLIKSQKNEVLILIKQAGLDPMDFAWEEREEHEDEFSTDDSNTNRFHRLLHQPSTYACMFGKNFLSSTPGPNSQESYEIHPDWNGRYAGVQRWLSYLKREVETPDLWASLAQEQELLSAEPTGTTNTPFTPEQLIQIKQGVDQLRTYLTNTYSLAGENLRVVNAKLDYLIHASKELGRVHWKDIFISTIIGIAWQLALPASGFHDMFRFAGQILRHVLGPITSLPLMH